eukprot:666709-Rhodomonas_salina.1
MQARSRTAPLCGRVRRLVPRDRLSCLCPACTLSAPPPPLPRLCLCQPARWSAWSRVASAAAPRAT